MGEGVGDVRPGTLGLLDLLDEYWEPLDYELLRLGLDINQAGTSTLDWRRLRAVITYLPPDSALAKAMIGPTANWSPADYMLAAAVDALNLANWQRTGKKHNRPKPLPRPADPRGNQTGRFGAVSLPLGKARAIFERSNRSAVSIAVTLCSDQRCDRSDIKARGMCGMHYQRWRRRHHAQVSTTQLSSSS